MRFGIMAMQMEALIPAGLSTAEVIGHIASFDHSQLVRGISENGFKLIELGGDLGMFLPQTFTKEAIGRLAILKRELRLSYTVHLPLWSVEPSTPLTPVREGSVRAIVETMQQTEPLSPEIYVLHATGALAAEFYRMRMSDTARSLLLRIFQGGARQSLEAILKQTGINSRCLAIETIEFPFDLTLELAEEFNLSMCLDTGHVLVGFSGAIDVFEALERCLPRLGEIHLHDGPWQGTDMKIGYGKDHQSLGKGSLELSKFMERLEKAGFDGPIIFELGVAEALASLDEIRKIKPGIIS
jgi:sugar phosphate isomerase/epimerase